MDIELDEINNLSRICNFFENHLDFSAFTFIKTALDLKHANVFKICS